MDKEKGYVYCPFCNKAWKGWDVNSYKEHPNHTGEPIAYPGVYIKLNFLSEEEERMFMRNIDEVPWNISQSGRMKQNYGPKTNFKKRKIVCGNFDGFPEFSKFIQDRFTGIDLLKDYQVIEQCSLEYDPSKGASIDPHIDDCWIWGERIITLNCLSDAVLTLTPYKGGKDKYNLHCADEYPPVVDDEGNFISDDNRPEKSALKACKPDTDLDLIIRIPMPRKSLVVMYGAPRYHWEHCVLREDIVSRRVCIAYREFTPPYMQGGKYENIGNEVRSKAKKFLGPQPKI